MLTGPLVRVRYARNRILPYYIDPAQEEWLLIAEQLRELFLQYQGQTRGELETAIDEMFGDDNDTLVQRGLAKLLEDRCGFETAPGVVPEELRRAVFQAAVAYRAEGDGATPKAFDRDEVLRRVGMRLSLTPEQLLQGLYADLKGEQRLIEFQDISPEHLLQRYNVSLAQAVVLRATRVHVSITAESPQRWRAILRRLKFHRLLCEMERTALDTHVLHLDGPLSLFSATQKYGLQLALFLPVLLPCSKFELIADLKWGTQKKEKQFILSHKDRLVWPGPDPGQYVPPELELFAESFRKRVSAWELQEETDVQPLGNAFWVPDFSLRHRRTGRVVYLEILGFWRKRSAEKHLNFLQRYIKQPFVLAVSDSLRIEEPTELDLPAEIVRFKHLPLVDEVVRRAEGLLASGPIN
jgi:predicted nuclease of restriction endonuclease-like RecB superfamily